MCVSARAVEIAFGIQFALALQIEEGRGRVEGIGVTSDVRDTANDVVQDVADDAANAASIALENFKKVVPADLDTSWRNTSKSSVLLLDDTSRFLPVKTLGMVNIFSSHIEFSKQEAAESFPPGAVDKGALSPIIPIDLYSVPPVGLLALGKQKPSNVADDANADAMDDVGGEAGEEIDVGLLVGGK